MRNIPTLFFALLFTALITAQVSTNQKEALIDLYISTNGDKWVNTWDLDAPVAEWHGVSIENDQVVGISLLFNNLDGTLPNSLSQLGSLKKLELSFNKITGTLPAAIGNLSQLEVFAINGNNFTGQIPPTFGKLSALKELHLSSNQLDGAIPVAVAQLNKLEILNVFDNNLTGTIPYALADNKNLKTLVISENDIVGTEAFAHVLLFEDDKNDSNFNTKGTIISTKTVIATDVLDDEN